MFEPVSKTLPFGRRLECRTRACKIRAMRIYVSLQNEGVDCWRPVEATPLKGDIYEIVDANPFPEEEQWQFSSGDVVRCKEHRFSDGSTGLVAYEKVAT